MFSNLNLDFTQALFHNYDSHFVGFENALTQMHLDCIQYLNPVQIFV